MMSETQNATTAERIALSIGERIISGALQPDAPLRQDHIAREFGSSHVPVREAFRQLEAQHLVIAMPRRGVGSRRSTPIRCERSPKCARHSKWWHCGTPRPN